MSRMPIRVRAVIQARSTSSRFPNKSLSKLQGYPLVWWIAERCKRSELIDEVCFAIPESEKGGELDEKLLSLGLVVFYGPTDDVLGRFVNAVAGLAPQDYVVRLTADDPFKCPVLVDQCISVAVFDRYDYVANNAGASVPEGLDVEVVKVAALLGSSEEAQSLIEREHVTVHIKGSSEYSTYSIDGEIKAGSWSLTVDYPEDLIRISQAFEHYSITPDDSFFGLVKKVADRGFRKELLVSGRVRNEALNKQLENQG